MATTSKTAKPGFRATMAEVAALAGVTRMTVSRVVRHPEEVNPETRERVTKAMATLGYVPSRLAGSLTAGSTGLVAAIVPTLRHSLFADTLEGLSDVLSEAGLGLFVSSSAYRTDVEESQVRSILERRPDAIVLTGLTHTSAARTPDMLLLESFAELDVGWRNDLVGGWNQLRRGQLALPERPGLGLELDEAAIAAHPYRPLALPSLWDDSWRDEFTGAAKPARTR